MTNIYYGIYEGIVSDNADPNKCGRIKVICPKVLGGKTESAWCRPVVPVAYNGGGDFCVPQKNEAVWIMFIGGDVNKPVYLGGWWSAARTPLGSDYSNVNDLRVISYSDCVIVMQNGEINISVSDGDNEITVKNGEIKFKGDVSCTFSEATLDYLESVLYNRIRDRILSDINSGSEENE